MRTKDVGLIILCTAAVLITLNSNYSLKRTRDFLPAALAWQPTPPSAANVPPEAGRTSTVSQSTMTTTAGFNDVIRRGMPMYAVSDFDRFQKWSNEHGVSSGDKMPRVLIFTWGTEDMYYRYVNEVYWKACYAHAHGFDIVFLGNYNASLVARPKNWPMMIHRGIGNNELDRWSWVSNLLEFLLPEYDYVFMMAHDTLVLETHLDFPVWGWDKGSDITMMDQYHFLWPDAYGINLNNILFKPNDFVKQMLEEMFAMRLSPNMLVEVGPFMELLLRRLGKEAQERGLPGYSGSCMQYMKMEEPYAIMMTNEFHYMQLQTEYFSQCFFLEVDRMTGIYGHRHSRHFGFAATFWDTGKTKLVPEEMKDETRLQPWANCWRNIRKWWPNPIQNCFAFRWNGPHMEKIQSEEPVYDEVSGQCPDPSFNWDVSPFNNVNRKPYLREQPDQPIVVRGNNPMYARSDWRRFKDLPNRPDFPGHPRVLMYTWCTEDSFARQVNEIYWKECYAHAHGFDTVFSEKAANVSQEGNWDHKMWTWMHDVQRYVSSGDYDYIFVTREDVLIQEAWVDFPVWAWDRDHDLSFMDEHYFEPSDGNSASGPFINSILLRPTEFSQKFLGDIFRRRTSFQSDAHAFMEAILTAVGAEAEVDAKPGYDNKCSKLRSNGMEHSKCFFDELDRIIGVFGSRKSGNVGFTPSFIRQDGLDRNPSDFPHSASVPGPWANCWSAIRKKWPNPDNNCFIKGYLETESAVGKVLGKCPDPTFDWDASPYNYINRNN